MTNGCPGCRAANQGGRSVNHNETCRTRFVNKMKEVTDPRIQRDEEKCGEVEEDDTAVDVPAAAAAAAAADTEPDIENSSVKEGEDELEGDDDMGMEYTIQLVSTRDTGGRYKKWNDDVNNMKNQ